MRFVILHGAFGHPGENWFPWLADQLREKGLEVIVPTFLTPERQSISAWKQVFSKVVGSLEENTVLIGHSTGAIFIPSILENLQQPIRAAYFIGGFWGDLGSEVFDSLNRTFYETEPDWQKVRVNAHILRAYYGENGPYVSRKPFDLLCYKLEIEPVLFPKGGHFNSEAGFDEFPELLQDIEDRVFCKQ